MFGVMTKLLAQLFQDLAKLPEAEQDAVAAIMLEELDAEARWSAVFGASQAALETLADEALAEYRAGETTSLSFDETG